MKILSWNVNGIRAILKNGFVRSIEEQNPDIVCLQEIKAHPDQVDKIMDEYPFHVWNPAEKKGYSGTAIFSKIKPLSVKLGIDLMGDNEGRIIVAEFDKFTLVNVYTPNSQRGLTRLEHRLKWDTKFLEVLKSLNKVKPVIFCGDLNVAHNEIDIARPKDNVKNAGFTPDERKSFGRYLENGFVDIFRYLHPDSTGSYTWWSYMHDARQKNIGWRIDYFCVSNSIKDKIASMEILNSVLGSDHCPIIIDFR